MLTRMSENLSQAPLLILDRVSLSFPAGVTALSEVSLSLDSGEVLAVLGPSGSGKTTLLKVMAGLLVPQSGTVRKNGERSPFRLGMTFQNSGIFDSMTCFENLEIVLREWGVARQERKERIAAALEEVGLSGSDSLYPHQISGGMKKRLGIARSLLLKPNVVLYDDPTAGLDPVTSRSICDLIETTRKLRGTTIVLVTSDLAQAIRISGRIAFLHRGQLLEAGTTEAIRNSRNPVVHQFMHGLLRGPLTVGTSL